MIMISAWPRSLGSLVTRSLAAAWSSFAGCSPDAVDFLAELAENNDREWFTPREADFERIQSWIEFTATTPSALSSAIGMDSAPHVWTST